jgi:hypothetical protein
VAEKLGSAIDFGGTGRARAGLGHGKL